MRAVPLSLLAVVLVVSPWLASCSSSSDFDPTEALDFLYKEEKLKGDRKPLFPEGVPGVSRGIPPDLVKGHQPTPETAAAAAPVEEPPPEKPKPKPRVVHRAPPKQKPTQVQVSPAQQQQQSQQAQQQQPAPAWPQPQQAQQKQQTGAQSPWPAPQKQTSPWPDAPPPNTFQR